MKHANPLSVWSRYSVLPIILFSFWSRIWIGWWCLIPAVLSLLWMFFNPIVFKKAKSTKNWASKAVLGERIYLNRDKIPLPPHHNTSFNTMLNIISSFGLLLSIWATTYYSIWVFILGTLITYFGKSCFLYNVIKKIDFKDNALF